MERNLILVDSIPTIVWGKESEKIYIYVHGKNGKDVYKRQGQRISKIF